MVLSHLDMEWYERFQDMDMYDRYNLVSLLESQTGVVLEDRYRVSVRTGSPIDLRSGSKRFQQRVKQAGYDSDIESALEESKEMLRAQYEEDKRLQELGIKRKINIDKENRELLGLD